MTCCGCACWMRLSPSTAVRKFVEAAFRAVDISIVWHGEAANEVGWGTNSTAPGALLRPLVRIDPKYYRPTEVQKLLGNPGKAKRELGWEATTTVEQLCKEMVDADLRLVKAGDFES